MQNVTLSNKNRVNALNARKKISTRFKEQKPMKLAPRSCERETGNGEKAFQLVLSYVRSKWKLVTCASSCRNEFD